MAAVPISSQKSQPRHFLTGLELSPIELRNIVSRALSIKRGEAPIPQNANRTLTALFTNPSLRTRLSFATAMQKMGGVANVVDAESIFTVEHRESVVMDQGMSEHTKEMAPVISAYSDVIAVRRSQLIHRDSRTPDATSWEEYVAEEDFFSAFAKYATKPVINMESNLHHPCQGLADVMTIHELLGGFEGKKVVLTWAPHPKPLPLATPHSQMLMPSLMGMEVTVAHPPGFELMDEVVASAKQHAGAFEVTHNQDQALEGADIVIAKSWAAREFFHDFTAEAAHRKQFTDWQVTPDKMPKGKASTSDAHFLHCLPVRRNVVVSDAVLDSPASKVTQQAENRMWVQIMLLHTLMNEPKTDRSL